MSKGSRLSICSLMSGLVITGLLGFGIAGCGGNSNGSGSGSGSGSSSSVAGGNTIASAASNVATLTVDAGPIIAGTAEGVPNSSYITVTVCSPSAPTDCNTIDHVLVDTGSVGLRLISSASGGELTVSLPAETVGGNPLSECIEFVSNVSYGSVRLANVQISGESATNVPVQVIGDMTTVPSDCAGTGLPVQDSVSTFGANGIIGVGFLPTDCDSTCTSSANISNGVEYYTCPSTGCTGYVLNSTSQEVSDPVISFAADNNGVIVELPLISGSGAATVTGALVFGINTQSNNGLGSATVFNLDPTYGLVGVNFEGTAVSACGFTSSNGSGMPVCGYFDTGTNTYSITDPALTACTDQYSAFDCVTKSYSGTTVQDQGATGSPTQGVTFNVTSADTLLNACPFPNNCTAYDDLASPSAGNTFWAWGLPFFYGRNVYYAIETNPLVQPYAAY